MVKVIVGLGNNGPLYYKNRHNVGFLLLDLLVEKFATSFQRKLGGFIARVNNYRGYDLILFKSEGYMNMSGVDLGWVVSFFKCRAEDCIILHDDLDLALGRVKVQVNGYHGGHNGLKSINQSLGNNKYTRVRIGIGRPKLKEMVPKYVLSDFPEEEMDEVLVSLDMIVGNFDLILNNEFDKFAAILANNQ